MNEKISIECAHCGARLKLKDPGMLGRKIRCPKCEQSFVAEDPAARPAPEENDEEESQPVQTAVKKKKKKKKKKGSAGIPAPLLLGGPMLGIVIIVGAVLAAAVMFGKKGGTKLETPDEFVEFNAPSSFNVVYPADWKEESGGQQGHKWATFTNEGCYIKVQEKLMGSLMVDIGGNAREDRDDEESAIHKVHLSKKEHYAEDYGSYEEKEPQIIKCQFGKTRVSEFTATKGMLGKKIRGYRMTAAAGNNLQVDIVCYCPAGDWTAYEPAYMQTLQSLKVGRR